MKSIFEAYKQVQELCKIQELFESLVNQHGEFDTNKDPSNPHYLGFLHGMKKTTVENMSPDHKKIYHGFSDDQREAYNKFKNIGASWVNSLK